MNGKKTNSMELEDQLAHLRRAGTGLWLSKAGTICSIGPGKSGEWNIKKPKIEYESWKNGDCWVLAMAKILSNIF